MNRFAHATISMCLLVSTQEARSDDLQESLAKIRYALEQNQLAQAQSLIETHLKSYPENTNLWSYRAFCSSDPLACAKKAVKLDEQSSLAHLSLGLAEYENGRTEVALRELTSAITMHQSSLAYNARGRVYAQLPNIDDRKRALIDFGKAVDLNPASPVSYMNRASILADRSFSTQENWTQNTTKALQDLSKVVQLSPNYSRAYVCKALVYGWRKNYKNAIQELSKAIDLNSLKRENAKVNWKLTYPENAYAYCFGLLLFQVPVDRSSLHKQRAEAHIACQNYAAALEDYNKAISYPNHHGFILYSERGDTNFLLYRYTDALADYSNALKKLELIKPTIPCLDSQRVELHSKRAEAYLRLSNYQQAITEAAKVIDETSASKNESARARAFACKGLADSATRHQEEAIKDLSSALDLRNNFGDSQTAALLLERAKNFYSLKKFKECTEDSTAAIKVLPNSSVAYYLRASSLWQSHDYIKALENYWNATILLINNQPKETRTIVVSLVVLILFCLLACFRFRRRSSK